MKKIFEWLKTHPYQSAFGAVLILSLLAFVLLSGDGTNEEELATKTTEVETIKVADFGSGAVGVAYPTASGNSFVVRSQSSGRVDRVIAVGKEVEAGTVIAELDNGSERAALTQAQGTYEAALAAAAKSDISLADAKTALLAEKSDALAANRAALAAWNNVLYNTVDQMFINPRLDSPGVRISAEGQAVELSRERIALNTVLSDWQKQSPSLSPSSETRTITDSLEKAISTVNRLGTMVDTFIALIPKQKVNEVYTSSELSRLSSEFAAARATLNSQRSSLESAKNSLLRAEETVNSATIGGTGGEISAADAAIKQALGSYQAARAAYERTIVKAPFAGTITSINVSVGDIIGTGADVSIIVPAEGEETTRWWNLPLTAIKYTPDNAYVFKISGDGKLEGIEVATGLVTTNSIKVTGLQGDETLVKDVRGMKAGDEVKIKQ